MSDAELAEEKRLASEKAAAADQIGSRSGNASGTATPPLAVGLAWAAVSLPLAWGVYMTLLAAQKFFN